MNEPASYIRIRRLPRMNGRHKFSILMAVCYSLARKSLETSEAIQWRFPMLEDEKPHLPARRKSWNRPVTIQTMRSGQEPKMVYGADYALTCSGHLENYRLLSPSEIVHHQQHGGYLRRDALRWISWQVSRRASKPYIKRKK